MAVYYIKHSKADSIKFVSHLDLQRALQRNITRADIGIVFSHGYNPHMLISSAQPLSVGMTSDGEYLMAELQTEKNEDTILADLNKTSPEGIRYSLVRRMEPGTKAPMALLDAVASRLTIPSDYAFSEGVRKILESRDPMKTVTVNKKGVSSEKDLRPFILDDSHVEWKDGFTLVNLLTSAGSRNHLNLDHLLQFFREQIPGMDQNRFTAIHRLEMYTLHNGKMISLGEIR